LSNVTFYRRVTELLKTNRTLATALEKEIASGTRSYDLTQSDLGIYCADGSGTGKNFCPQKGSRQYRGQF
jgi:hypothetical protein